MTTFDAARLAGIQSLQRDGEAEALYRIALMAPPGRLIVELGTFHGYTAGVLALAAEQIGSHVTTIDNYLPMPKIGPHIGRIGVQAGLAACGLDVTVLEGDSRVVPPGITEVGMLWIDSTHTEEHVLAELAAWLPLVIVNGIVAFHDYGGASTPQLKPPIDKTFQGNRHWRIAGAFYTVIGYKRVY